MKRLLLRLGSESHAPHWPSALTQLLTILLRRIATVAVVVGSGADGRLPPAVVASDKRVKNVFARFDARIHSQFCLPRKPKVDASQTTWIIF